MVKWLKWSLGEQEYPCSIPGISKCFFLLGWPGDGETPWICRLSNSLVSEHSDRYKIILIGDVWGKNKLKYGVQIQSHQLYFETIVSCRLQLSLTGAYMIVKGLLEEKDRCKKCEEAKIGSALFFFIVPAQRKLHLQKTYTCLNSTSVKYFGFLKISERRSF